MDCLAMKVTLKKEIGKTCVDETIATLEGVETIEIEYMGEKYEITPMYEIDGPDGIEVIHLHNHDLFVQLPLNGVLSVKHA
jgi:hypothetical protein